MVTDERLNTLLVHANPVPDVEAIELVEIGATAYLKSVEQRSSAVTQLDTKTETPEKKTNRGLIVVLAAAAAVILAVAVVLLQDDSAPIADDPVATTAVLVPTTVPEEAVGQDEALLASHTALLDGYAAARNAGDIGAAVAFFQPGGARVQRHPLGLDFMSEPSELRITEERVPAVQGSGSGIEFFDIEVSDGSKVTVPDVTFSYRFLYGADGSESGGEAGCIGGKTGKAFVENGFFAKFDWGFEDPSKCVS